MNSKKKIVILGATGSIGSQTLDVVREHSDRLQVVGLMAHKSTTVLRQRAAEFGVEKMAVLDVEAGNQAGIPCGMDAVIELVTADEVDMVVVAVAGVIGLVPTIAAIQAKKDIALASKEVLVAAGEVVMPMIQQHGVQVTPIDSEHSALFQCLGGLDSKDVESVILTASGGPFRGKPRSFLESVTLEQALDHPTWRMGGKITVDSATLFNKGLEMIEAKWLYGLSMSQVSAVIHPQSIVHSFVRFKDGSVLAQLGWPDMRLPIQIALLWPERKETHRRFWNPTDTPNLTFESPDEDAFPALRLAREADQIGGTMPCAMNAANEAAVAAFLNRQISFLGIAETVEKVMVAHRSIAPTLDHLLQVDQWARERVRLALN